MRCSKGCCIAVLLVLFCLLSGGDAPKKVLAPSRNPPCREELEITPGKGGMPGDRALVRVEQDGSRVVLWRHHPAPSMRANTP